MSLDLILEDWSDYDDKTIRDGRDGRFFACEEKWEVDYLVRRIKKEYPLLVEEAIRSAISACCQTVRAPRPRRIFVDCVLKRLGIKS